MRVLNILSDVVNFLVEHVIAILMGLMTIVVFLLYLHDLEPTFLESTIWHADYKTVNKLSFKHTYGDFFVCH